LDSAEISAQLRPIRPPAGRDLSGKNATQQRLQSPARGISLGRVHAPQDTLRISFKGYRASGLLL
jgi:hypothetical protein